MRRQLDAFTPPPAQQNLAQQRLQLLNLHGNCGLRPPDALPGACKTLLFGDIDESAQQIGIETSGQGHEIRIYDFMDQNNSFFLWARRV
jgi:hypothetical protein